MEETKLMPLNTDRSELYYFISDGVSGIAGFIVWVIFLYAGFDFYSSTVIGFLYTVLISQFFKRTTIKWIDVDVLKYMPIEP